MIGHVLDEEGYRITTAANNRDAIQAIEESNPDLIVLDLIMGEGTSIDLIEYLQTAEGIKDIPLIVITQKNLTGKEIKDLDGRIQAILNKGILSDQALLIELKDTIAKL